MATVFGALGSDLTTYLDADDPLAGYRIDL